MKLNSYFKNEKLAKIIMSVLLFLIIMLVAGMFVVKAEDNETKKVVLKEWTTQLLYDTTNACYEGTIRWVLLSHHSLLGSPPNWRSQRQMIEHCFCVMDRIRKEIKIEDYQKLVYDQEWTGNTFMTKALECVKEEKTLPSFFVIQDKEIKTTPIPKGKIDNPPVVPDGETEDSKEESPDQKQEESEGSPQTIFQG
jgi:hypothetical protein